MPKLPITGAASAVLCWHAPHALYDFFHMRLIFWLSRPDYANY